MSEFVQTVDLHRFVYDDNQVKRFAKFISSHNGVHQLFIAARPKYQTEEQKVQQKIKHRKTMTKSFHNVTPERFLSLVKSFEQPIGTYDGHKASVLVIYGTTNPRDVKKANQKYLTDIIGTAFVGCDDDDGDAGDDYYPIKRGQGAIQAGQGRRQGEQGAIQAGQGAIQAGQGAIQAGQGARQAESVKIRESENEVHCDKCGGSKPRPIYLADLADLSPLKTATTPTASADIAPNQPPKTTTSAADDITPLTTSRQFTRFLPDNLHSYLMSSKGHVSLLTMDIDDKSALASVDEFLQEIGIPRTLVETRGGYHLFIDTKYSAALFSKPKFREFTKLHSTGDTFCPIPGTFQGGFPVRFVD